MKPYPADVDPTSGFRLPLPRRDELDDLGQRAYDAAATPGATVAGLRGPAGIALYSPRCAHLLSAINHYLRHESGIAPDVREVAILSVAREMDSQFEWAAHEGIALAVGVPAEVIEIIRTRSQETAPNARHAAVIELTRQALGRHQVEPDVFARARSLFGEQMLVELVHLIGNYASTAVLLAVFDMQLPPGKAPGLPA